MNSGPGKNIFETKKADMKQIYKLILALFVVGITFVSCDDTLTNDDIDSRVIPSSNVSYAEYIQPLFQLKCNTAGCHNSRDIAGGLSLDNHAEATSNVLIVFPELPDNSKLVWAIEGRTTSPMPPVGWPPLTKNQITGIKTWIKEGAKNN